jgi:cysteinyl-tRNA synthetase
MRPRKILLQAMKSEISCKPWALVSKMKRMVEQVGVWDCYFICNVSGDVVKYETKKDFTTSDEIRNQLQAIGISIIDEKDGGTGWSVG